MSPFQHWAPTSPAPSCRHIIISLGFYRHGTPRFSVFLSKSLKRRVKERQETNPLQGEILFSFLKSAGQNVSLHCLEYYLSYSQTVSSDSEADESWRFGVLTLCSCSQSKLCRMSSWPKQIKTTQTAGCCLLFIEQHLSKSLKKLNQT